MLRRRRLEGCRKIDIGCEVGNRWKNFMLGVDRFEVHVEELRLPLREAEAHQTAADEREITPSLVNHVVRLVVREKIRPGSDHKKQQDRVKTDERQTVVPEALPNGAPLPFGARDIDRRNSGRRTGGGRRGALRRHYSDLRPKAIRGSTAASKMSESRMPISVKTAVIVRSASTMG